MANLTIFGGIACLIWLVGIVFGVMALRGKSALGGKEIARWAWAGVILNTLGLLAIGVSYGFFMSRGLELRKDRVHTAELEYYKLKETLGDDGAVDNALIQRSEDALKGRFAPHWDHYTNSMSILTDSAVLDMALVTGRQDLRSRRASVQKFIGACEELRAFLENATNVFKEELQEHKISTSAREAGLKTFIETRGLAYSKLTELTKLQARWGELGISILDFLDANWGKWEYKAATRQVVFQDSRLAGEYQLRTKEIIPLLQEIPKVADEFDALINFVK